MVCLWSIFLVTWAAMAVIMGRDNHDITNLSLLTLLSPSGMSQVLKLLLLLIDRENLTFKDLRKVEMKVLDALDLYLY